MKMNKMFPAWAGVIPADEVQREVKNDVPRMGGGDPFIKFFLPPHKYLQ
jgi:hypothetical protein